MIASLILNQHTSPDYSMAYVVLETDDLLKGHGSTFTCGKGTEIGRYFKQINRKAHLKINLVQLIRDNKCFAKTLQNSYL